MECYFRNSPKKSYVIRLTKISINQCHKIVFILMMLMILIVLCSCHKEDQRPNIVLITIDTLRADHLTPYGYKRNTSPFLDKLAKESIIFKDAVSQCGSTPQSLSSIMTGLYPYTDDLLIQNGPFWFLKKDNITLGQILRERGYITHAITSSIQSSASTGMELGFETFDGIHVGEDIEKSPRRIAEEITGLAVDWLTNRQNRKKPFFLWLHYLDPHHPYKAPGEFSKYFAEDEPKEKGVLKFYRFDEMQSKHYPLTDGELLKLIVDYDREIRYTDQSLEVLFKKALAGYLKNTLIIVTADHGEALGNHNIITHNDLYQTILHVPLLVRLPGEHPRAGIVNNPVMLIDIFPTILDLLKIPLEKPVRGESLKPLLFSEGDHNYKRFRLAEYPEDQALFYEGTKLIARSNRRELYDLKQDIYESNDLIDTRPEVQTMMIERASQLKHNARDYHHGSKDALPKVTPEMINELKALGYITK